jgi:hypothetical protein
MQLLQRSDNVYGVCVHSFSFFRQWSTEALKMLDIFRQAWQSTEDIEKMNNRNCGS